MEFAAARATAVSASDFLVPLLRMSSILGLGFCSRLYEHGFPQSKRLCID